MTSTLRTALALLALCALGAGTAGAATSAITIPLKALGGSGESGSATLTQTPAGVRIVVTLANAPADAQPTHIHAGTCGNINKAPEYALVNTVGGSGTSTLAGVTLADLLKGKYAINVHKSTTDLATYVACGNISAK